jgi:hypothetical protein
MFHIFQIFRNTTLKKLKILQEDKFLFFILVFPNRRQKHHHWLYSSGLALASSKIKTTDCKYNHQPVPSVNRQVAP